jgi:histidinol-phosphatase (PHP family)
VIVDYHMHLRSDGNDVETPEHTVDAVERYVETARARGVDEIGISEHVYYFREGRHLWSVPYAVARCRLDLEAYVDAVVEAKRRGLPVKLGMEVDWLGENAHELDGILAPYPWDYLLVSVHWIGGVAVDQRPGLWADRSVEDVWRLYFGELARAAGSGLFDALSHPDLAKIFGDRPAPEVEAELHAELVAACDGVALEVSAAGLHKPVGELYPDTALLRAARAAGLPITLASDAHAAADVGRDIDRAVEHARGAGYETVSVFGGRTARQEPLG